MNTILLGISASSFYGLTLLLIVLKLIKVKRNTNQQHGHLFTGLLGITMHFMLLSQLVLNGQATNLNLLNSITSFACITTLGFFVLNFKIRIESLALILLPINIISIWAALIFPGETQSNLAISAPIKAHILLSTLAYCCLSIGALLAIMLAIQDYQLRQHKPGVLLKSLPPLDIIEKLLFQLITIGFVLLSLALASGFWFSEKWLTHKILFSCFAWIVFCTLLVGRHVAGWRGKTVIRWTLGGVIFLMLGFFGTKLVWEYLLTNG